MKKIVTFYLLAILFLSCSGNDDDMVLEIPTETAIEMEEEVIIESPTVVVMGDFISGAHPTSGKAVVDDKKTQLTLSDFKTDTGPKLLLYLSTDIKSTEYVNLGDLKGIEGDFTYAIPENTDLKKYKYVNVWCVDFSVSFGHAILN
jgi:hypothetical protein